MTRRFLLNLVAASCAVSAGIHAALVPAHLDMGGLEGLGFAIAAVLLLMAALAVVRGGAGRVSVAAAGVLLGGLISAYAIAGERDALGVITQFVQLTGLAAAIGFWQYEGVAVTPRRGKEISS